ncbi:MAG: adenylate kinase family protein [archaeon YNP-LCB-024-027]|jgi:adenylate kinase|nr:adenylate kinase family protein [Candidatus Culexarchaeum yellowstonense]
MKGKVIIIGGCPGTGKTSISRKLSETLNVPYIDLSKFVIEENLFDSNDPERNSFIPNNNLLISKLLQKINESKTLLIIEGHYADIVPPQYVLKAFVLRLHPKKLETVLRQRGWNEKKVYENVMAELLDTCLIDTIEQYGPEKVVEIDVTDKCIDDVVNEILAILSNPNNGKRKQINWIETLEKEGILNEYLSKLSTT